MSLNNKGIYPRFQKGMNFNSKSSSKNNKSNKSSKFDIKKYKVLNSFLNKRVKFKKINEYNDYNTMSTVPPKKSNILYNKDDMPYIPSKEKQKGELNFIKLIKSLMNNNQHDINKSNSKQRILFNPKISNDEPYKPKGYNYYRYSREHPELINDSKRYMKIIHDLNKKEDEDTKVEKERCLSYNNFNSENKYINQFENNDNKINKISLNKTKIINNIKLNNNLESNSKKILPYSKSFSKYDYTLSDNNLINSINTINDNIKTERLNLNPNFNSVDNEDINNNKERKLFPLIKSSEVTNSLINYQKYKINKAKIFSKKDYNKSDIFNLKEDIFPHDNSKQILLKNNYAPLNKFSDKKTSINEVGWSPNNEKVHSRISISSVAFNILCPNLKNISPMKKDVDKLNNNNSYKSNLMSEFIDMSKPGDSELRKEYQDKLNYNKNIFHRKNYCSYYHDMHHEYKDLIIEPF